jgi:RNase H-fold protein (predicted Holliday junction resolvase)
MTSAVLGIDPGTRKVGFALITGAESPALAMGIESLDGLFARLEPLVALHPLEAVALGGGTHAAHVRGLLARLGAPVHLIDETDTSYRARALYFADHPPGAGAVSSPWGFSSRPGPSTTMRPSS